ncbi:YEATS family protein [Trichostrongylus colubriformis]|uniref:YEATS family protein n=1 Tax=Trichostrongylus colubriformis TaxID=6319 RepID=A0AAN8FAK9_TRICO
MGVNSRATYVKVLIGHESFALDKPLPNNHRFRWILFVRPIIGSKFTDRTFLSKVEVELHPTFANPFRVLKEPPFELEETGYASFTPKLIIYFNTPHAKPYPVQYDMNLKLEKHAYHQQEMTFAMSDVTPSFLELVRRFCGSTDGKRKKRDAEALTRISKKSKPNQGRDPSSFGVKEEMESEKRKNQGRESEKSKNKTKRSSKESSEGTDREMVPVRDASPESSLIDTSTLRLTITPQRPVKVAPNKAEDRGHDSSSDSSSVCDSSPSSSLSVGASSPPSRRTLPLPELHRRLTSLTDENLIYRVAEILLTHPTSTTMLLPSKPSISFDLTSADAALVAKLSHVLMKTE